MTTTVRTNNPTTVPGIPKPPADVSPSLRAYLEAVSEALEIRLGRRGDPRDRAVTLRELINSGLAQELRGRQFNPNRPNDLDFLDPAQDLAVPPRPTGFSATGGYSLIQLYWDFPTYGNHSLTEIWRHDSDVLGDAQLVGVSPGLAYVDAVGEGESYYYWVRHVSTSGVPGPFNATAGTLAETALNVELILSELTGAITESQLHQDLEARIDLIDADASVVNSVAYQIAQETAARVAAINQEISDRTAAVTAEATARTAAIAQEVSDRNAAIAVETSARNTAVNNEAAARASAISTAVANLQSQIDDLNAIDPWSSSTSYAIDDQVVYNNKLWKAAAANSNSAPSASNSNWTLIGDYTSLGDAVGANAAAIQQINYVDANSSSAAAQAIAALEATVDDPTTGVAITASGLSSLKATVENGTTGLAATVTRVGALEATVDNVNTGVVATSNALDLVETTVNDGTNGVVATANRVSTLESTVGDGTTGLAATRALLINDYYTSAETDSAITTASTQLSAAINLKNRTYRQAAEPASAGLVSGDIWYDSDDGNKAYRWNGSSWDVTDDTRIAGTIANLANNYYTSAQTDSAISAASLLLEAQIDGKNTTFRQATAPSTTGRSTGDLWFDSDDNNRAYRFDGTNWVATDDARIASTLATLTNDYYTKTATDSAIATATLNLVTNTGLSTALGAYATTATLTNNYYTATETDSAISAATSTLVSNTDLSTALGSYVTNSTLTSDYYTATETDSAISAATSTLVSTTDLSTTLGGYVTNATLTNNYYTRTATDSAISTATQSLVSTTDLSTTLGGYVTNSTLTSNYYTITDADSAISTATQNLVSTTDLSTALGSYPTTSTLTTNYYTKTQTDSAISAQTSTLSSQIGAKNRTYRQASAPSSGLVTGDVWFDSDDGNKSYRWNGSSWVATDDTRIAGTIANLTNNYYTKTATDSAITAASQTLQSSINSKNRSFYQAAAPGSSGLTIGDLWFESDNNNKAHRWNGSSWVAIDDARIASTAASLTNNYYTKADTDSAISTATQSLVSTTSLSNTLGAYATNATLTNNYYTKTATDSAISAATQNLVSSTTLNNYATNATLTNNYYTKTATDSAISTASSTLTSTFNNTLTGYATNVALQQNYYTKASGEALEGRYTVKIDANGYVAGFGLAVNANDATPTSEFIIRADRFSIGSPGQTSVIPFIVQASATTINGVSVPAGVYMNDAYIRNGTITNAKIGAAAVDNAKIADASITTAKIGAAQIYEANIANGQITNAKIGNAAITSAKIGDAQITNAKIGTAAVDTLQLAGESVIVPVADTYSGYIAASWPTFRTSANGLPSASITLSLDTEVLVLWGVRFQGQSSGAGNMIIEIYEGTTRILNIGNTTSSPNAVSNSGFVGGAIRRSKAAGTYTYSMRWTAYNSPLYEAYIILLGIQR